MAHTIGLEAFVCMQMASFIHTAFCKAVIMHYLFDQLFYVLVIYVCYVYIKILLISLYYVYLF